MKLEKLGLSDAAALKFGDADAADVNKNSLNKTNQSPKSTKSPQNE